MFNKKNILIISLVCTVIFFMISSCTPVSKLKYIQRDKSQTSDTIKVSSQPYFLQKGDNINIDVKTSNPEMRTLINGKNSDNNISASMNQSSLYFSSYIIDNNWEIELPLVGIFNCQNRTLESLKDTIESSFRKFITDAIVTIKLVNTNFTVLGEVNRPGQFFANQKQVSLLDAIGMAGDLTIYGNRKNITILRKLQNGDFKTFNLDITKANVISHEAFTLMPNDIVYVEPMKTKPFGLAVFPYSIVLNAITTAIVIISFLK